MRILPLTAAQIILETFEIEEIVRGGNVDIVVRETAEVVIETVAERMSMTQSLAV